MCDYFDDVMAVYSGNIFLNKKLYKNILIRGVSYKRFMGLKLLRVCFDKIDGFLKNYDGIRYLVLLSHTSYWTKFVIGLNIF